MDGANWRPTQGPDPATVDPNAGGQWSRRQVPILLFPLGHAAAAAASASSSSSIHPPIELLLDPHRIESKSRGMDGANWRPIQGPDPNAGGDWRTQLQPEARSRIVNKIIQRLKKHLEPVSVPEGLSELQKIAEQFEDKVYTAATSQTDYLRRISLKILSIETETQQPPGNAQVIPNQNPSSPGAAGGSRCSADASDSSSSVTIGVFDGQQLGVDDHADGDDAVRHEDWRTQLQPVVRSRIVNKTMETLKKHLKKHPLVSVPEGLSELQKIAERFEEKIYTAATSQSDYLRRISLKILSMETETQQPPGNAQVIPNQNPSGPAPGLPPQGSNPAQSSAISLMSQQQARQPNTSTSVQASSLSSLGQSLPGGGVEGL